jgi:hypothetical protein
MIELVCSIVCSIIFGTSLGFGYGLLFYLTKKRSLFLSKISIPGEMVRLLVLAVILSFFLLITSLNLIISMVFFIIGFWGVILKQERIF